MRVSLSPSPPPSPPPHSFSFSPHLSSIYLLPSIHSKALEEEQQQEEGEEGPPSELDTVCRFELIGGLFEAFILDNRIAQAHIALAQVDLTDTRSISRGWHYRTLLSADTCIKPTSPVPPSPSRSLAFPSNACDTPSSNNNSRRTVHNDSVSDGDRTQSEKPFAIPSSSSPSNHIRNFVDVTMCTPVEDTVKVGLTVHYALVVLAVDTVRDICDEIGRAHV